jgi:hypothetical protein
MQACSILSRSEFEPFLSFKRGIATDSGEISYAFFKSWPLFIMVFLMHTKYEFQIFSYTWDIALRNI